MRKTIIAFLCLSGITLNAQTTGIISTTNPSKANGYISWHENTGSSYRVKVYWMRLNARPVLISSTRCTSNYFKFNSAQLTSSDLYYTIGEYGPTGTLLNESEPAPIGTNPPPSPLCYIDCNGLRESYRISLMEKSNGTTFLMASDDAGIINQANGEYAPYYQAIDAVSYNQLSPQHPYRALTATQSSYIYLRDHIQITPNTPGGPYYDAQHNQVINGWLVEKRMDKYAHYNGTNTGNYQSSIEWCEANIGLGTSIFNNHLDTLSVPTLNDTIATDQNWFWLQTGTTPHGSPIYQIPNQLFCSTISGGSSSGGQLTPYGQVIDLLVDCFITSIGGGSDSALIALINCVTSEDLDGFGGVTVEGVNNPSRYSVNLVNNGTIGVSKKTGVFTPGLYRFNVFYTDGTIIPRYAELGVSTTTAPVVEISIVPNVIINSELSFGVTANFETPVSILVQKLDGTTVHSESVTLEENTLLSRVIPISGNIPYNQLRVSVILQDGTVIQQTALTQ